MEEKKKGKLHAVLAVEGELKNVAAKVVAEGINTFTKKVEHFTGHVKRLEMFDENRKGEEDAGCEDKVVTSTVNQKLDYVSEHLIRFLDALAQKERTNCDAKADVVIGGLVLMGDVPVTLLLSVENHLMKLRALYESIPTLKPGITWLPDENMGDDIFRAEVDAVTTKTEKSIKVISLAKPTKEHKEQVQAINADTVIGKYVTVNYSGMVSSSQKSKMLDRLDKLVQAVKKARTVANIEDVVDIPIGKKIVEYINKG